MPIKKNFKIYQGSTFQETLYWEATLKAYAPITGITKTAPMVVISTAHSIPAGWSVKITNAGGMKEINSTDTILTVTSVGTDSMTFNDVNSLGYTTYTSGGVVEYYVPVDLTGYTARMQIRAKLEDATEVIELTTENGGITVDDTTKTISLTISATDTALFTFTNAVYSLELVNTGVVTTVASGMVYLVKEVTR